MLKRLVIACLFVLSLKANAHPLHFSVINIEQNKNAFRLVYTLKFFTDDLERIVNETYHVTLNLGKENENNDSNSFCEKYISEKLKMKVNDVPISNIDSLSKHIDQMETWITFYIPYQNNIHKFEICNKLLLDLYYDQTNLFMLNCNGREYTQKMDYVNTIFIVYFD